jgi:hypothetical protein
MSVTIGYASPKFVPRDSNPPKIVSPGKSYFIVKIHSAQIDFSAPIWQQAQRLVVTSSVSLNHPVLGTEPIRALQFSREVQKKIPQKLGTSKNIIDFVPAIMNHVSISIDFIMDVQNQLANLSGMINAGAFVASISLGPGAAVAAKTVSEISNKLVSTFIPNPNQQKPMLQFTGDFNIPAENFRDGYYVILGTNNPQNPLPAEGATLEVTDDGLLINGKPACLSYIILDVFSTGARTRDLNEGAVWDKKLKEAEGIADNIQCDPTATIDEKNEAWAKCKSILKDAQVILNNDDNYLRDEANNIYRETMMSCYKKIFGENSTLTKAARGSESKEYEALEISKEEDLDSSLNKYANDVAETKELIQKISNKHSAPDLQ